MRIVSWNVNSIRARLPRVLELLGELAPDVVCAQELKCTDAAFPAAELAEAGYTAVTYGGGRWAGVGLFVPAGTEVEDARCGLDGEAQPEEARWVEATLNGVRVASVYVPNGREVDSPTFADKLVFLEAMAARMAASDAPTVVAGDLNVTADDRDVWDPAALAGATHVTPAERDRFAALLATGFVDAYRALHPDTPQFTWWDYRGGAFHKNEGLRIDYVLLSAGYARGLQTAGIARSYRKGTKPSDHVPLVVDVA